MKSKIKPEKKNTERKSRKKILVMATTFPRWKNDTEPAFVYELSKLLAKKGHNITVLAPHHPGAKKYEIMESMKIIRFGYFIPNSMQKLCYDGGIIPNIKKSFLAKLQVPFLLMSEYHALKKLLKKERFDVVHAHWIIPQGYIAGILKKRFKFKLLVTAHAGDVFPLKNKFLKYFGKKSIEFADYITANSRFTKTKLEEVNSKASKATIIPMGVDFSVFKNKSTKDKSKNNRINSMHKIKDKMILSVGRLAEKKGIKYLLSAMPDVLKKYPELKLVIVGDGPEKNRLLSQAEELKIKDSVVFTGKILNKNLPDYYSSADVFVLPSIITKEGDTEGLGVVLLEAIASGAPVIASNVGGIPDIVINEKTGILVPEKNPKALSDSIIKLLGDKELSSALGKKAKIHVQKSFQWSKVSSEFDKIIKKG